MSYDYLIINKTMVKGKENMFNYKKVMKINTFWPKFITVNSIKYFSRCSIIDTRRKSCFGMLGEKNLTFLHRQIL